MSRYLDKNGLIIFTKNPEKGKVKTRLAQTVGEEKALAIYIALMEHTRKIAEALPVQRYLFYNQFINQKDQWKKTKFYKILQIEADLGAKMAHAFQHVFKEMEKVVIIGSDCASLTPEIVEEAFNQLEEYPFVIGPAMDGGYYLLGMNQFAPEVFKDIEWSTATVFPTTLEIIERLGKTCYLLPTLSDIDFEEDWDKYGWELPTP